MLKVTFYGAAKQVTGSMELFEVNDLKILIDCGNIQTNDVKTDMLKNMREFNFNPREIDYCIVTHAHIDHCGMIPYLIKSGFNGPVLCTEPTMEICAISLKDCAYIWQREIERALKTKDAKKLKITPKSLNLKAPYTIEEAEAAMTKFRGYGFDKEIKLKNDVTLTFRHAGHILGAASLEFSIPNKDGYKKEKVLFTGDISGKNDFHPFIKPVQYIDRADYVICESTYGNKKHNKIDVIKELSDIIEESCIKNGKTTLIAVFSVQRLQEILYYLHKCYEKNEIFNKIPIYVDTPMGKNVSETVYAKSEEFYNDDIDKEYLKGIFTWDMLKFTESPAESMALANGKPKIILSSAGMMQAGRIINHIESFLPAKGCSVVLTGYCAIGTFGRKLTDCLASGKKKVQSIMGHELNIRANVYKLEGLSGHSDKNSTINYLSNIKGVKSVILNHGEIDAIEELKNDIENKLKLNVIVPNENQTIRLK